jgi:hypothetical protein
MINHRINSSQTNSHDLDGWLWKEIVSHAWELGVRKFNIFSYQNTGLATDDYDQADLDAIAYVSSLDKNKSVVHTAPPLNDIDVDTVTTGTITTTYLDTLNHLTTGADI